MTSTTLASTSSLLYSRSYAHDVNRCKEETDTMTSRAMSSTSKSHYSGLLDPASGLTRVVKCTLDEDQCLSLEDILSSFQTAINEEQAWALCYQAVKCFSQHFQSSQSNIYLVTDPAHLFIHKEGFVHQKSLFPKATKKGTTNDGMCHPQLLFILILTISPCTLCHLSESCHQNATGCRQLDTVHLSTCKCPVTSSALTLLHPLICPTDSIFLFYFAVSLATSQACSSCALESKFSQLEQQSLPLPIFLLLGFMLCLLCLLKLFIELSMELLLEFILT